MAMTAIGPSSDRRTTRWRITCPACGKRFEPRTTLMRFQDMGCPKCDATLIADYNSETLELVET